MRINEGRRIDFVALSKSVSHALRHEPWLYELELDDEGWASVDALVAALRRERGKWATLTSEDLVEMNERSDKRRYELCEGRIRALYGHSLAGKLKRVPCIPPESLYHGTSPRVIGRIRASGLQPMGRQYVHLSTDEATARAVGKRKSSEPVVLRVRAREAHEACVRFYEGNAHVWLADDIPARFIDFGSAQAKR